MFEGQVSVFRYDKEGKRYRDLYPDEEEMRSLPHPPKESWGLLRASLDVPKPMKSSRLSANMETFWLRNYGKST